MLFDGMPTARPSASFPLLIAMQSSPDDTEQRWISTSEHESGSMPSVLGPSVSMVMFSIQILRLKRGWHVQNGLLVKVTLKIVRPSTHISCNNAGRTSV